jgi:hypothetical protein
MAGDDNGVGTGRKAGALLREGFAYESLHPVSLDGATHLARHRQTEAGRPLLLTRKYVEHELARAEGASAPDDAVEIGAS